MVPHGATLFPTVHLLAQHQLLEVHLVGVEFGPVDADELGLFPDGGPAAAAHPRAVDHDRIEAHYRLEVVGSGRLRNRPHHDDGADREDQVDLLLFIDQLLQFVGDKPMVAVRAVVGRHEKLVADRFHLIFEDEHLLGTGPDDRYDLVPRLVKRLGDGIDGCDADTAADTDDGAELLYMACLAERPDHVEDRLTESNWASFFVEAPTS